MVRRLGFTLVELLVVLAIIGVLIALLLPAVQSARASARRTKCANHLRQVGLGISMYADSHDGYFPRAHHAGLATSQSWIFTVAPYVERVDAIRICPEDPFDDVWLKHDGTSYLISEYIAAPGPDFYERRAQIEETSKTILVFEGSDLRSTDPPGPGSLYLDHAHPRTWFQPSFVHLGFTWGLLLSEIQPDRHTGEVANYMFADGHVESIPAAAVRQWAEEGYNFALPGKAVLNR